MYFGEVINSFEDLIRQHDKFPFSNLGLEEIGGEWWDDHKDQIEGHRIVCAGFTDYGGDLTDKLVYDAATEIYHNDGPAYTETTSWNGGNAIVFGEIADKMCEKKNYDIWDWFEPLGDFEEKYTELQDKFVSDEVNRIKRDADYGELTDDEEHEIYNWLVDNCNMLATQVDYRGSDLDEFVEEMRANAKEPPKDTVDGDDGNQVNESDEGQSADKIQITKFAIANGSTLMNKLFDTRNSAQQEYMANSSLHDPKNPYKVVKVSISYDV